MCQRYWNMGVYATSKLPKFYRTDFEHDLLALAWNVHVKSIWTHSAPPPRFVHVIIPSMSPKWFWTFQTILVEYQSFWTQTTDTQRRYKSKIFVRFGLMWQTKYALAVSKNLGLGFDFWPCSEGDFLTGCTYSVILT